eukprot:jgi/Botrbrau1/8747/Bobra.0090s0021.1
MPRMLLQTLDLSSSQALTCQRDSYARGAPVLLSKQRFVSKGRMGKFTVSAAASTDAIADLSKLPLPQGEWQANVPVIGETFTMLDNHLQWFHDRASKYGPVFRTHVMGEEMYAVGDFPSIERLLMRGEFQLVTMKQSKTIAAMLQIDPARSRNKESHARMRRQQMAAFTPEAMAAYAPKVEAVTREYIEAWAQQGKIHLGSQLHYMTLDHADALVVGLDLQGETKTKMRQLWLEFMQGMYGLPMNFPGTKLWKSLEARKKLLELLGPAMTALQQEFTQPNPPQPKSMLTFYMVERAKAGDPINTEDELSGLTLALFLAGHETSQSGHAVLMTLLPLLPKRIRDRVWRHSFSTSVPIYCGSFTFARFWASCTFPPLFLFLLWLFLRCIPFQEYSSPPFWRSSPNPLSRGGHPAPLYAY